MPSRSARRACRNGRRRSTSLAPSLPERCMAEQALALCSCLLGLVANGCPLVIYPRRLWFDATSIPTRPLQLASLASLPVFFQVFYLWVSPPFRLKSLKKASSKLQKEASPSWGTISPASRRLSPLVSRFPCSLFSLHLFFCGVSRKGHPGPLQPVCRT